MKGKNVTIKLVDNVTVTGQIIDTQYNILTGLQWIKLKQDNGIVLISSDYIISILQYDNFHKRGSKNRGD